MQTKGQIKNDLRKVEVVHLKTFHIIFKKKLKCSQVYNHFHNILRLFDVLPNFAFTTSQMNLDLRGS